MEYKENPPVIPAQKNAVDRMVISYVYHLGERQRYIEKSHRIRDALEFSLLEKTAMIRNNNMDLSRINLNIHGLQELLKFKVMY